MADETASLDPIHHWSVSATQIAQALRYKRCSRPVRAITSICMGAAVLRLMDMWRSLFLTILGGAPEARITQPIRQALVQVQRLHARCQVLDFRGSCPLSQGDYTARK